MKNNSLTSSGNRFFCLPFAFETERLLADLAVCEAEEWIQHFNTKDYQGDWTGIALRSPSGLSNDILAASPEAFVDTPLLARCAYIREIISSMACPVETVRLLALTPGSKILEHRDQGLGYAHGRFRLHIPIITDPRVDFLIDGYPLHMEAGECWYADFSLPHSVSHEGVTRRIHLVIDALRNDWTDTLFDQSGYDFSLEKKLHGYDRKTMKAMIRQLSLIGSPAAQELIASLESELFSEESSAAEDLQEENPIFEDGWAPVSLVSVSGSQLLKWQHLGPGPYQEPFFHETLRKTRQSTINKRHPEMTTSWDELIKLSLPYDHILPKAFIFHTSRCGSSLLAQLLMGDPQIQVLAEVPLLDEVLRLPYQQDDADRNKLEQVFQSVIHWFGRLTGNPAHGLWIKTDSWHVLLYEVIRRLYPDTPFFLLYRNPEEVIRSHERQPGIQAVPFWLESSLTGIPYRMDILSDRTFYMEMLLDQLLSQLIRISQTDSNAFLIHYADGWERMMEIVSSATGVLFSDDVLEKMAVRSGYHAKRPYEPMTDESRSGKPLHQNSPLLDKYLQLEAIRKKRY